MNTLSEPIPNFDPSLLQLVFSLLLPHIQTKELLRFHETAKALQGQLHEHIARKGFTAIPLQRFSLLNQHQDAPLLPIAASPLFDKLLTEATNTDAPLASLKDTLEIIYLRWPNAESRLLLAIEDNLEDTSDDPDAALLAKLQILAVLPNPLLAKFHGRFIEWLFMHLKAPPEKRRMVENIVELLPYSLVLNILRALPEHDDALYDFLLQLSIARLLDIFLQLPATEQQELAEESIALLSVFLNSDLLNQKSYGSLLELLYHFHLHTPNALLSAFSTGANIARFLGRFASADASFAKAGDLREFFIPLLAFYCAEDTSRQIAVTLLAAFFHNHSILTMQPEHARVMQGVGALLVQYHGCDETLEKAVLRYSQSNPLMQNAKGDLLHVNLFELIPPPRRNPFFLPFLRLCEQLLLQDPVLFFIERQRIRDYFSVVVKPVQIPFPKTVHGKILLSFLNKEQCLCCDGDALGIDYESDWAAPNHRNLLTVSLLLNGSMTSKQFVRVLEHIAESLSSTKKTTQNALRLLDVCLKTLGAHLQEEAFQAPLRMFCQMLVSMRDDSPIRSAFWTCFTCIEPSQQSLLIDLLWQKQRFLDFSDANSRYVWQPERFETLATLVENHWRNAEYDISDILMLSERCNSQTQAKSLFELVLFCIEPFTVSNNKKISKYSHILEIGHGLGQALLKTKQYWFCAEEDFWRKFLSVLERLPAIEPRGFCLLFSLLDSVHASLANLEAPILRDRLAVLEETCYKAILCRANPKLLPIRYSPYLHHLILQYNKAHPAIVSKLFRSDKLRRGFSGLFKTHPDIFTEEQRNGFLQAPDISLSESASIMLSLAFWKGCEILCPPENKTPTEFTL